MAIPSSPVQLLDDPVFRSYFFYSSVLVLKMMFMSIYTGMTRIKTKTFANPEDGARLKVKVKTDDQVERIRRAHLNDIENIVLFFVTGYIYSLTSPNLLTAKLLFMIFTAARIVHTVVYTVVIIPQPARALAFFTAYLINGYMAVQSLFYFLS